MIAKIKQFIYALLIESGFFLYLQSTSTTWSLWPCFTSRCHPNSTRKWTGHEHLSSYYPSLPMLKNTWRKACSSRNGRWTDPAEIQKSTRVGPITSVKFKNDWRRKEKKVLKIESIDFRQKKIETFFMVQQPFPIKKQTFVHSSTKNFWNSFFARRGRSFLMMKIYHQQNKAGKK